MDECKPLRPGSGRRWLVRSVSILRQGIESIVRAAPSTAENEILPRVPGGTRILAWTPYVIHCNTICVCCSIGAISVTFEASHISSEAAVRPSETFFGSHRKQEISSTRYTTGAVTGLSAITANQSMAEKIWHVMTMSTRHRF